MSETATDAGSAEIRTWLDRAESTYLAAQSNGDTKSAGQAISVAVRSLTALAKQKKVEAEAVKAVDNSPDRPLSIQDCDAALRQFRAKWQEKSRCFFCQQPMTEKSQEKIPDALTN
jgi:hypothetical protein